MKLFDKSYFPNFLDYTSLTSNEVCNSIINYKLEFIQFRNNNVEWGIQFPMFLYPFYKWVFVNKDVPKQIDFYKYYLKENDVFFKENNFSNEIVLGLKARIFRTYPSLVRDLHFSLFLNENFEEASVIYNRKLDVEEGIDILIQYQECFSAINLYTNTTRAHIGRKKKEKRHSRFINVDYIELPVEFKGSEECGQFFLYGEREFSLIKNSIK